MKKQTTKNTKAKMPEKSKVSRKTTAASKKPTYIYTEEDLGEGILDEGVSC